MSGRSIQDDYARSGPDSTIAARIIAALPTHAGADIAITPETLAPIDHLHGRGMVATEEPAALFEPRSGEAILDRGSGVGGTPRWIAAKFDCAVAGVDLTAEHWDATRELNAACGLSDRVRIMQGSALAQPPSFDRAYSHNVVMNIADKAAVYRNPFRVLSLGGRLALSHINAAPNGPVESVPVGWASVPENSFLATHEETRCDLAAAGSEILAFLDLAAATGPASAQARRKLEAEGLITAPIRQLARPHRRAAALTGSSSCRTTLRDLPPVRASQPADLLIGRAYRRWRQSRSLALPPRLPPRSSVRWCWRT